MAETVMRLTSNLETHRARPVIMEHTEAMNKNLTPAQRRAVELARQQIIKAKQARAAIDEKQNSRYSRWVHSESREDSGTKQGNIQDPAAEGEISLRKVQGGILRSLRTRDHKTLREISEKAGVSLGYLSEVERGQKEASSELLMSITEALGVRLSDMLVMVADQIRVAENKAAAPGITDIADKAAAV